MLRDLDIELIKRESHRFDTKEVKTWLKPILEAPIDYDDLIRDYNLHEFTIHWYDSGPNYDHADECKHCRNNCDKCKIWQEWDKSERQLTHNNWIDVEGPGIWGDTQKECNESMKERFETRIFKDEEFGIRTYYYQPPEEKYFNIFWYNRDRDNFDYWFVFKKKAGADLG